jgi:hypothetical protein
MIFCFLIHLHQHHDGEILQDFFQKNEMDEIFKLLQDHFHQSNNPVELIKALIRENEEMKNQLHN